MIVSLLRSCISNPISWLVAVLMLVMPSLAHASPANMPAINWPFDTASVVAVVVSAGVLILGLVYGPKIGFKLVHRLIARIMKAI